MDKKQLQAEIDELQIIRGMMESEVFQKFFAKPLKEERDKLRTAFFSDSLKDSWRKGGKQEGIKEFFKICEAIPIELKNKLYELKQYAD